MSKCSHVRTLKKSAHMYRSPVYDTKVIFILFTMKKYRNIARLKRKFNVFNELLKE